MRHKGHIRQRSDNSFEIRYDIGTDPLTGKRRTVTTTVKGDRRDAEKELYRILHNTSNGEHIVNSRLTVAEYLKQWIETVRSQINPKTHERYAEIVRNFLIPSFGHSPLPKLTPVLIQSVYNKWETSGRRDGKAGGLAPRTRLGIHRVFFSALKHAVQLQLIIRNPAEWVKPPRAKKVAIETLTIEQATELLAALKASYPRLYWPVLLALTTGMRRGEVLALRWKNVDFDKMTIRVVESLEQVKQTIRFKAPKTEKGRAIMLLDYAAEELKAWKKTQADELKEMGITANEDSFVCGRWDGGPVKPDSLTGEFVRAIRKIPNVPVIRFHDLRHSHATQLLTEGIHPKIAQERLGHSSIKTTLDLYSHVTDTMQGEAASKLDSVFRSAMKAKSNPSGPKLG